MNSFLFDIIEHYFGSDHLYAIFYFLNLIFAIVAYKLGFAKKLYLLQSVIVYILLIVGVYVITIFSIFKLPITETLIILSLVLGLYRLRLHRERKGRTNSD